MAETPADDRESWGAPAPREGIERPPSRPARSRAARLLYLGFGILMVALGAVGAFLPLLPTTVFLLAALWAFARSSDRLHAWLWHHPRFGPPIRDWTRHGAIGRRAKVLAVALLLLSPVVMLLTGVRGWVVAAVVPILVAVGLFIVTRPAPPPKPDPGAGAGSGRA